MASLQAFLLVYLIGGLTFLPAALLIFFLLFTNRSKSVEKNYPTELYEDVTIEGGKKGWIQLSNDYIGRRGLQTYRNGNKIKRSDYYGVLNKGTLYLYDSNDKQILRDALTVFDYTVSIYPEGRSDADIFGRSASICLRRKKQSVKQDTDKTSTLSDTKSEVNTTASGNSKLGAEDVYYLMCERAIDKEDWYLALTSASHLFSEEDYVEMIDETHFDSHAMEELIATVIEDHKDGGGKQDRHADWLNALLGRLFLSLYKTNKSKEAFEKKVIKKIQKLKGAFWENVRVSHVNVGHSIPYITEPKLLSLCPDGGMVAEASVTYSGEAEVEITLDAKVIPSAPELTLKLRLCHFSGRFMIKIKPPPSNRLWIGFYKQPDMDWEFEPTVNDTSVRRLRNTINNVLKSKIQSSLEEIMVLPNMEDIAFFDSAGRGGIFGERVPVTRMSRTRHGKTDLKASPAVPEREGGNAANSLVPPSRRAASDMPRTTHNSSPELREFTSGDTSSIKSTESHSTTSSSSIRFSEKNLNRRKKSGSHSSSETDDTGSRKSIKETLLRKKDYLSTFLKKKTGPSQGADNQTTVSEPLPTKPLLPGRKPVLDVPSIQVSSSERNIEHAATINVPPENELTPTSHTLSPHSPLSKIQQRGPPPPPRRPTPKFAPETTQVTNEREQETRDGENVMPNSPLNHNDSEPDDQQYTSYDGGDSDHKVGPSQGKNYNDNPFDTPNEDKLTDSSHGTGHSTTHVYDREDDNERKLNDPRMMNGSQSEEKLTSPPLPPRKELPCIH